jgi:hypothetical protein
MGRTSQRKGGESKVQRRYCQPQHLFLFSFNLAQQIWVKNGCLVLVHWTGKAEGPPIPHSSARARALGRAYLPVAGLEGGPLGRKGALEGRTTAHCKAVRSSRRGVADVRRVGNRLAIKKKKFGSVSTAWQRDASKELDDERIGGGRWRRRGTSH